MLIADSSRGDEVVLLLNSGGGTVTGYGLAASQLSRLKSRNLPLTVCVDEVAASGGYMMACVGDRIVASPFAVLGSIGVVATMPNFYERLQREGVSVEDITAGKFKRTLTPYKKSSDKDRSKVQSDVDDILKLFTEHIKKHRPSLDLGNVATGETWLGTDALKLKLCDSVGTSDEVLLSHRQTGAELYALRCVAKKTRSSDEGFGSAFLNQLYSFFLGRAFKNIDVDLLMTDDQADPNNFSQKMTHKFMVKGKYF